MSRFYPYRFEFFFFTQLAILFGSLLVPAAWFENVLSPILFQLNLLAGILLISKKKAMLWFSVSLLCIAGILFGVTILSNSVDPKTLSVTRMSIYFLFYVMVAIETIKQVWKSKKVSLNVIFGVISGYISLGLIGFFICLSIELIYPGSFHGLYVDGIITESPTDRLIYFSFITLLTVGYGDILPATLVAEKAAILIGLLGQFYLVIITATIVGKYINQTTSIKKNN